MYQVICTSYNETKKGLVLRQNWIQTFENSNDNSEDFQLIEFLNRFRIPTDFKYPSRNSITDVLTGRMDLDGVVLHVRIVRF
jgi:hypothetical protein